MKPGLIVDLIKMKHAKLNKVISKIFVNFYFLNFLILLRHSLSCLIASSN